MPKRTSTAVAAVAAVLALLLTGCAGTTEAPSGERTAPTESAAPLVAATQRAPEPDDAEAAFIADARGRLAQNAQTQIPDATDQQLIDAGRQACERLAAGEATDQMSLIEGEIVSESGYYWDSAAIIAPARMFLCPE